MNKKNILIPLLIYFISIGDSFAYFGLGAIIPLLWTSVLYIIGILLSIVGFFAYPFFYILKKKNRNKKNKTS